ncbi:dTMP kinase [Nesterenkonia rhizosphaerae]|uniref:Thymidylate kinase n=1 Tax=Nesterenkonia rhizosphaerae TaxID=1348272 RepID=A0ABP9G0J9_9MICC
MTPAGRGIFITFEGPDGAGKTTQLNALATRLRKTRQSNGDLLQVVTTREPGGTQTGKRIRSLLLDSSDARIGPQAELLLFAADRANHVDEVIRPALDQGHWVLCDRFEDSTRAYQGAGRSLPSDVVDSACRLGAQGMTPDLTLLLDVPPEVSAHRRNNRGGEDRMESAGTEFHESVRQEFLQLAASNPQRFLVLDGTRHPTEIHHQVWIHLASQFLSPDTDHLDLG